MNRTARHIAEDGPSPLAAHLHTVVPLGSRPALRDSVLPAILTSVAGVAQTLQAAHRVSQVGSANAFGDDQLNVDVLAEDVIREALAGCAAVVTASSEEDPVERPVHGKESREAGAEQYTVAFDPLDGSSIIAPNWTVGVIVGIWDGATAVGQPPATKQIAAVLGVLGPRTTAFVALRIPGTEPVCLEIGLSSAKGGTECEIVRPIVRLAEPPFQTRYFAPANLRLAGTDAKYMSLITHYVKQSYTLRYCGGLVPDVVHALVKGHGVYVSPVAPGGKSKLRRLYELYPIALVIECCGGKAIDPADGTEILNTVLGGTDERAGLICGTSEEVEFVKQSLFP